MNRITFAALAFALIASLFGNFIQHQKLVKNDFEITEHHVAMTAMMEEIAWQRQTLAEPTIVHVTVYADNELITAMLQNPATTGWEYSMVPFFAPEGAEIDLLDPGCPGEEQFELETQNDVLWSLIDPSEMPAPLAFQGDPRFDAHLNP